MANIERLKELRAFIEKLPPEACDMHEWLDLAYMHRRTGRTKTGSDIDWAYGTRDDYQLVSYPVMEKKGFACGTVGCFGGWTSILANKASCREQKEPDGGWIKPYQFLGLDPEEEKSLFHIFPSSVDEGWKAWMLKRLDSCIKAGKILELY